MLFLPLVGFLSYAQQNIRKEISLNAGWNSVANDTNQNAYNGFESVSYNDKSWEKVSVPHNWDQYEGYRRMKHGNRHGYAWYRKKFSVPGADKTKRYFLWFEGVGSYATVWLNGKNVGHHNGGRTSFTLDVTDAIHLNGTNVLAVRADHPASIKDLPWVCGGCSEDRGFSEGSQPMGIFRPVHLIVTNPVRIEPFGVHIWNDEHISAHFASLNLETEIKNYGKAQQIVTIINRLLDHQNRIIAEEKTQETIPASGSKTIMQKIASIKNPHLWSLEDPYLYTMVTEIKEKGKTIDQIKTPYGIRWISWPIGKPGSTNQFYLNGKPVFINGTAEYEHLMGRSHAFAPEEIIATVKQIQSAGFNAFRDAHQPHNLLFQEYWDSLGILWWPQFSAHIWYDSPEFRSNFKALLRDWIKERRNSPSVILWGLQNESKLPEDFAKECSDIIRKLDPTTSSQRLITTCNGGEGTDWDVPQNWTGTYGGNPATYATDIQRQILIGEYGAWRSLDLHTEGPFQQNGVYSEDRMTQLMEMKVRLAESVRDKVCGQFHWLFSSHENPGRTQGGEGYRELDRVGPVNYKGLLTPWMEPLDVYYMFRANYAPKEKEPMVYIVSHTWPDRWTTTGKKDSIVVYSNCDEVELFNDVHDHSLGTQTRNGIGTHFQWDGVNINYNVLYAEGKVNGKVVARDTMVLNHLPQAPHFNSLYSGAKNITAANPAYHYLYRVNCGGPDYTDTNGNLWMADQEKKKNNAWGSVNWTNDFAGMPAFYASQRWTKDPVNGTKDWNLFQNFRYGMDKLRYQFSVADGDYLVELYFMEPWYGRGGGLNCTGWRLFDVALNDSVVLKNFDIWKEAGHNRALKKTFNVHVTNGQIEINFPNARAGEGIISAIAIASKQPADKPKETPSFLITNLDNAKPPPFNKWKINTWLNTGDKQFVDGATTFSALPPELYGVEWISTSKEAVANQSTRFQVSVPADVYVAMDADIKQNPSWLTGYADTKKFLETDENGGKKFQIYTKRFSKNESVELGENGQLSQGKASMYSVFVVPVTALEPAYDLKPTARYEAEEARLSGAEVAKELYKEKKYVQFTHAQNDSIEWKINVGVADMYALRFRYINHSGKAIPMNVKVIAADGTVMNTEPLSFPATAPEKWGTVDSSTGTSINAGTYSVILTPAGQEGLGVDFLEVQ